MRVKKKRKKKRREGGTRTYEVCTYMHVHIRDGSTYNVALSKYKFIWYFFLNLTVKKNGFTRLNKNQWLDIIFFLEFF